MSRRQGNAVHEVSVGFQIQLNNASETECSKPNQTFKALEGCLFQAQKQEHMVRCGNPR
jgi:hypothetical protein